MKFLVDESVGTQLSKYLMQLGHDSISVAERFFGTTDEFILSKAKKEERVIITNDKDFGELIFYRKLNSHGVILLRLLDNSAENKIITMDMLLSRFSRKIKGKFVVVSEDRVRMRKIN